MIGTKTAFLRFFLLFLVPFVLALVEAAHLGRPLIEVGLRNKNNSVGSNRSSLASAEVKIKQYLESHKEDEDARAAEGEFYIQGWRWHTMSLVREANRLNRLAQKLATTAATTISESDLSALKKATDYVVDFNMKGLHKIEKDLFFPWVRNTVFGSSSSKKNDFDISVPTKALTVLMDRLENDRKNIESLGRSLVRLVYRRSLLNCFLFGLFIERILTSILSTLPNPKNEAAKVASDPSIDEKIRTDSFSRIASESEAIADCAKSMLMLEDSLLVPVIARVVPAPEQKSFNDKVIRKLGILDSRLHLVGMHEAVQELDNDRERQLFQTTIPKIPQMMIPRWKRLLYEPRVGVLDKVS